MKWLQTQEPLPIPSSSPASTGAVSVTVLRAIKLALMYCWGFGWFSSFYYSSDYHLLFLNGICFMGYKEPVLQRRLCSNSPCALCWWGIEGTLVILWNLGSQPPFAQFIIHKGSLKAGSRHRSCTWNGSAPGEAGLGQVSISATKLALPQLAAAAALSKFFSLLQYYYF